MTNQICVYDFTVSAKDTNAENIKKFLKTTCKAWCFQLEVGMDTGYEHYQGRFSLMIKKRKSETWSLWKAHGLPACVQLSPTAAVNKDNMFYVMKQETRMAGPWKDDDPYVPLRFQLAVLRPWQNSVIVSGQVPDDRGLNIMAMHEGNKGKSFLCMWALAHKKAIVVPATIKDPNDVMQWVGSRMEKLGDMPPLVLMDMPRAMNQEKTAGIYAALETIKNGYAYDTRYTAKEYSFEPPVIWVFCNTPPKLNQLSSDRWQFWHTDGVMLYPGMGPQAPKA